MKRITWKKYGFVAWSCLLLAMIVSCNKNIENKLEFGSEPQDLGLTANQYKIAYIVVEGAVGVLVGGEATDYGKMPNMAALSMNGVFSWNSVSSEHETLATNYADLLTGTEIEKHQVADDRLNGNELATYPTLFKRIKQYKSSRTALLTSNPLLPTLVERNSVDNSKLLSTDSEVLSATREELGKEEAAFVMATFTNVRKVGEQTGYGPDNEKYIAALANFDSQLGEIRKSITTRKNYKNERWLIVVASTNGGKYTLNPALQDGSVFAVPERNNFVLMNNPEFSYKLVERMETVDPAWISSAVRYSANAASAVLSADQSTPYNFGTGANAGDYTIQLKLKVYEMNGRNGKSGTAQNGVIFGKQNGAQNFPVGWSITYNGGTGWRFIGNSSTGANYAVEGSATFDLDTWYTLTVKIYKDGDNRVVKMYRDGDLKSTNTTFAGRNLSSDSPLKLGYYEGSYGNNAGFVHAIADVRIYKAAIPDEIIKAISCSTMATPSSPFYNDLIGYWPADDLGTELKDNSKNKRNFILNGSYVWNSFSERGPSLCPTLPDRMDRYVVRTVDAPLMIYNWMNILEVGQFNLDAQSWTPAFSNN
ncbi:LamG-like jellyroll fold domain-containing protein [Sphingobacterium sp.]|uniref:LamG-like jellyroll fold domain-containing protein n=1 Tax=Sphingobacterium sp. TaxID=341027 RepID=UPI00289F9CB9|nr:LamG-like jellyroll fold domain-containing protein [Sphingobacterium sp.]